MSSETLLNGRYRLIAQQGSGGMAVIYRAVDESLGRTVAVKVLRPSLTADPAFITRFQNEARAIANLSHPNIVTVHDVGTHTDPRGTTHYIVMEFVQGSDLKKVIRDEAPLNVNVALNYAIQICAGIGFAHRAGIVHADVKPQNILLNRDHIVKVTDFGIAQALSDTQPTQKETTVWGSPHYFAPEQARGEKPSAASDVYAIGIVMFEMLTGRLPYMGVNQQELALAHIRDRVPLVTEINPNVPDSLAHIVHKVMSKEPSQRYRMADQLGHILINYRDRGRDSVNVSSNVPRQQTPIQPAPERPSTPPPPPSSKPMPPIPEPPSRNEPPSPPVSVPTERYSVAPEAPNNNPYNRNAAAKPVRPLQEQYSPVPGQQAAPGIGSPPPSAQQGIPAPNRPPQSTSGFSGPFDPRLMRQYEEPPRVLDTVTLILAFLAFLAVVCLIPLYIAVLQNY